MARSRKLRMRRVNLVPLEQDQNYPNAESPTMHLAAVSLGGTNNPTVAIAAIDWLRNSFQLIRADSVAGDSVRFTVMWGGVKMVATVRRIGVADFRLIDLRSAQ